MYTMKQACEKTGLSYETLKFYCNQGLVRNCISGHVSELLNGKQTKAALPRECRFRFLGHL